MEDRSSVHLIQAKERVAGIHPEIGGNFPVDQAVIEAVPPGTKVLSAESFGASAWSVTARINAENEDGTTVAFFLKCTTEDSGRAQLHGEYTAMSALRDVAEIMIPRPISWGKFYLESPPTYFFLAEFKDMSDKLPDPAQLGALIAELHQKSVSPTGKFGFGIQTYDGKLPHNVEWNSDWTDFFTKLLTSSYDLDVKFNGVWTELAATFKMTIDAVIPRLLNALTANGKHIKPCLIHGDLWEGNIGTEYETGRIYIFDSAAYYAHNEMEIASWTCKHHKLRAKAYKREYLRHFDASEPVDEWEDRSRLYGLKELFINSAHFPGSQVRERAYDEMCFLVEKYAPSSEKISSKTAGDATPKLFPTEGSAIADAGIDERSGISTHNTMLPTDRTEAYHMLASTNDAVGLTQDPPPLTEGGKPIMATEQVQYADPAYPSESDLAKSFSQLHLPETTTSFSDSQIGTTKEPDSTTAPSSVGQGIKLKSAETSFEPENNDLVRDPGSVLPARQASTSMIVSDEEVASFDNTELSVADNPLEDLKTSLIRHNDEYKYSSSC